jgi:hypothetical protein
MNYRETEATVSVPNTVLTEVLDQGCAGYGGLLLEVTNNDAAVALADFEIQIKVHHDSDYQPLLTGTDWETNGDILLWHTADVNTLAATAVGVCLLDLRNVSAIKVLAKAAVALLDPPVSTTVRARLWKQQ